MHPAMVAPHLTEFAQAWCRALHDIRDNEEKDSSFRGLCQLVHVNPSRDLQGEIYLGASVCHIC